MFSPFVQLKRNGYLAQRSASQGAGLTLVPKSGEFVATFECARLCAKHLGNRDLVEDEIPSYAIPLDKVCAALGKLSEHTSIAIVDYLSDGNRSRFVLLWKIERIEGVNLDEY